MFKGTWMEEYDLEKMSDTDIYVVAIYWAVQTITTVGYGDVSSVNSTERMFCAMMMVIGVISFSFANGSLTSIMQNYDVQNAEYQSQMESLNKIYHDFRLPLDLFIRIKKSMGYEIKKDIQDHQKFLDTLPVKLKTEVSLYVYEQRYNKIKLFEGRDV